jgi:recombination protein RecA
MGNAAAQKSFEVLSGDGNCNWQMRLEPEYVPSGIAAIDAAAGGIPRGALTEIVGPVSSGRTSLLLSILAEATAREEVCAVVDAEDCFSPHAAEEAGVELSRVLWVRCAHDAEQALKVVDLLIQGGGFGVVVLDMGDTPLRTARRISLTSWFRLRRAAEQTSTVLISVSREANARTCASLVLECARNGSGWSGTRGVSRLLRTIESCARATHRRKQCSPVFTAKVI